MHGTMASFFVQSSVYWAHASHRSSYSGCPGCPGAWLAPLPVVESMPDVALKLGRYFYNLPKFTHGFAQRHEFQDCVFPQNQPPLDVVDVSDQQLCEPSQEDGI